MVLWFTLVVKWGGSHEHRFSSPFPRTQGLCLALWVKVCALGVNVQSLGIQEPHHVHPEPQKHSVSQRRVRSRSAERLSFKKSGRGSPDPRPSSEVYFTVTSIRKVGFYSKKIPNQILFLFALQAKFVFFSWGTFQHKGSSLALAMSKAIRRL